MSEQKYCPNCGWTVTNDKACQQCGTPSFAERQTLALERIADSAYRIANSMEDENEFNEYATRVCDRFEEIELHKGYTD